MSSRLGRDSICVVLSFLLKLQPFALFDPSFVLLDTSLSRHWDSNLRLVQNFTDPFNYHFINMAVRV